MLCNKHGCRGKKTKSWEEEAPVYKMSHHLDRPREPISAHQRWPSQSWQGTQRGWGSLDWRWRTRSFLVLEPRCPLAGPQQEPETATMSSQCYCTHSADGGLLWMCDNCRYAKQPALIMIKTQFTLVIPGKSTRVRFKTLGEKIFKYIGSGLIPWREWNKDKQRKIMNAVWKAKFKVTPLRQCHLFTLLSPELRSVSASISRQISWKSVKICQKIKK